tara:strand:+ start:872 stop:1039 length:168 start_codon:yes stop_codon:yes gene_type:complete
MNKTNKKIKEFELFKEIDNFFNGIFDSNKKDNLLIKSSISHKFINKKIKRKKIYK